jgi:hypothetical protein
MEFLMGTMSAVLLMTVKENSLEIQSPPFLHWSAAA